MNTEVITLYIFQAILGIVGPIMAYMPLKYLNHKALGMQTIYDQMMKDLLYLMIFKSIFTFPIMALVVEFLIPVNHYVAILINIVSSFSILIVIWQYTVLIGVRFLSTFHPMYLNNESLIKTITRCSISFITLISILSSDLENSRLHNFLSGENPDTRYASSKPYIVTVSVCIIAQVIVQYKIEMFKKTVDSQSFDELLCAVDNQRRCEYGTRVYNHRMELTIMASPLVFVHLLLNFGPEEFYTRRLMFIVYLQLIFLIAFPGVIISKNDNMQTFIKSKFKSNFSFGSQFDDVSKKYVISENRVQDTFDSSIVDQEDRNDSMTNFHDPRRTIPEISVIKEYGTQETPISDINPKDRHVTRIFHSNEDNNTMSNIDDPMPGCSHW